MNNFFRTVLIINLVSFVIITSLGFVCLPVLFEQQRNASVNEVKTALSLFEISARKAVNSQNKAQLEALAQQLLLSPSINYVKVTDESSQQLMVEAGKPLQQGRENYLKAHKLAQKFNNQQIPAKQINPLAWVEIEFSSPTRLVDWLKSNQQPLARPIILLAFLQLILSLIAARILRPKVTSQAKPLTTSNATKAPQQTNQQSAASVEQQYQELKQQLSEANSAQLQNQQKLKQLVALSSRANSLKKALLEQLNQAYYVVDEHNHVIEASPSALSYLGIAAEQLTRTNLNEHFQPKAQQDTENSADFIELLVSYPEQFCLLVRGKNSDQQFYATHITLNFHDDALYLVRLVPIPTITKAKPSQTSLASSVQQLQLAELYSPLKAACFSTLHQLNNTLLADHLNKGLALDSSLRLSSLLRCLPWVQNKAVTLNTDAYSVIHLFEQRLSTFAPLLACKNIDWGLVINPELKPYYQLNLALTQAIFDLQLYLISLYPEGTQVLFQFDLQQQQIQLNIDVEQANHLQPIQQSLLACSSVLLEQIGGEQQQYQDSLCLTMSLESTAKTSMLEQVKTQATQIQVLIDIEPGFAQQCLNLQLQLFGLQLLTREQLEQIDTTQTLWYVSERAELPEFITKLAATSLKHFIYVDTPPPLAQLESEHRYCLRPRLSSFLYEQLITSNPESEQQQQREVKASSLAAIAAEGLAQSNEKARLVFSLGTESQAPDYIAVLNESYGLKAEYCTINQAQQRLANLASIESVIINASQVHSPQLAQLALKHKLQNLIILQDSSFQELPKYLAKLSYQQIELPVTAEQLYTVISQQQLKSSLFEQLFQDEQLLDTLNQTEQQYSQIINQLCTSTEQATSEEIENQVTASTPASYLKALYPIFSSEARQRLSQINRQLQAQQWPEVQKQVQEIILSAQKFDDVKLSTLLGEMLQASLNKDSHALELCQASLSEYL
ncbi:hypothetical protein ACRRS0_20375 [Agarivorans sp. QJM3NY_29]|uniref:PAS domain-containing protein n=1 Tax=unclassified Agarivorans TaxID=2636026 RepID=UPI003D7D5449